MNLVVLMRLGKRATGFASFSACLSAFPLTGASSGRHEALLLGIGVVESCFYRGLDAAVSTKTLNTRKRFKKV